MSNRQTYHFFCRNCGKQRSVTARGKCAVCDSENLIPLGQSKIDKLPARGSVLFAPRNGPRIPLFARAGDRPRSISEWCNVRNAAAGVTEITINGEIGSDWYGEGTNSQDFKAILDAIPRDNKIIVLVDSPGGNVWDGLAISNLLKERRANVTVKIYGVALSIASVIAVAGSKVIICKTSQFMAHDPWSGVYVVGTEEEIGEAAEKARNALKAAKKSIVVAYKERTGKSDDDILALMKAETWYVGEEARAAGFVDEVSDDEAVENSFDLSGFRRVPANLRKPQNSAPKNGGHPSIMNREQILARLKKLGVTVPDNATDEQLVALLDQAIEARQAVPGPSAPANDSANRIAALEQRVESERRGRVTAAVDTCVNERRITADQRDRWIARAMTDEAVLNDLRALPQVLPEAGLPITITSESPEDICKGIMALSAPIRAIERGNSVDVVAIKNSGVERSRAILKNLPKLQLHIQNAHTIDADLKRSVIMTEGMDAFRKRLVMLSAFSTRFNNVPLLGTDKIQVPYYPLFTTASTDFVQNNGYVMAQSTDVEAKEVTIDKRKYQPFEYDSAFLARQPYFDINRLFARKVEQLAVDVVTAVQAPITLANFGAAVKNMPAAAFALDTLIEIRTVCEQADWPTVGRSAILDSTYEETLLKGQLKVNESGTDKALREGVVGRVAGFDIYGNPRVPSNAESLVGYVCLPSAILAATSPVMPAPGVRKQLVAYDVIIDPITGMAFEYRHWGDADNDEDREIVECNFGYAAGEAAALKRITNA